MTGHTHHPGCGCPSYMHAPPGRYWTSEQFMRIGEACALHGVCVARADDEILCISTGTHPLVHTYHPDTQRMCAWAAEWRRHAFPTIQIGHKFAAALLATSVPDIDDIRAPWPAYLVTVPDGLIQIAGPDGTQDVERILVLIAARRWTCLALGKNVCLVQVHRSLAFMRKGELDGNLLQDDDAFIYMALEDLDERAMTCVSRLLLNSALVMSDPTNVKPIGKGAAIHNGHRASAPNAPVPLVQSVFEVGKPIKIDCRNRVRAFMQGEAHNISAVQWLVRGHFRNQPHGPGKTERRMQWIEPYWKGDDAAPILTRPHTMKEL